MLKQLMNSARNALERLETRRKQLAMLALAFFPAFAHAADWMAEMNEYADYVNKGIYAFSFLFFLCCVGFGSIRLMASRMAGDHSYGWMDFLQLFVVGAVVGGAVAVFAPWAWEALGGTVS
ncbi:hypothetical protein D3C80_1118280 [compost metagenome]